jgi:hypothetical protein
MADAVTAAEVLRAGIQALAHADVERLEELAAMATAVRTSENRGDRRRAREGLRALECLLTLTRRNLRLLRGARSGSYGSLRG